MKTNESSKNCNLATSFFNKIVDHVHEQGGSFTFDVECCIKNCKNASEFEQEITHPEEGKMCLNLCRKCQKDFEQDVSLVVEVKN
jgi:hypothetical protein